MSLDTLNAAGIEEGLTRWASNPGPEPQPGFSAIGFLSAGAQGIPAAVLQAGASAVDAMSGYGNIQAASGGSAGGMFSVPSAEEQKQEAAARERMLKGDNQSVAVGNQVRSKVADFAPDPLTSHKADQVMYGLTRFGTKAIAAVGTMGPAGALLLGLEEGNTVTQELRGKGVDTETAVKVGAVQGGLASVGAVLPLAGKTVLGTVGLVGVGGPGSYMAQEALSREILQAAGYQNEASLHNPFDPLGLTLSAVIPGAFGAFHLRSNFKRAEAVKAGTVPLEQLKPEEMRALKYDDPRLDKLASQTAEKYGVPPALLLAIKNAGEKSGPTAVSGKGAQGVMQFMPGTAKEMGLADRTDPVASIDAGARYLRKLYDAYGSWDAAVTHYNGGGAQAAIVRGGGKPTAKETIGYLDRVQQFVREQTANEAAQHPEAVDAARVVALNDTMARSLPDTPDATAQVFRAADIVGESGGRAAQAEMAPGAEIPRAGGLGQADRAIEDRLARRLGTDMAAAADDYAKLPDSMGGKILNTDVARELSPDYLADRTRSAAVHEPASWFVKQLYEHKLAELKPGERVVFTSGGTGAGKTTAIQSIDAARQLQDGAAIVYDTNMNSLASAVSKIEKALKAGAEVHIVHVQRDPVEALVKGALPRAMRQEQQFGSGRTVPLAEHARTHRGAAEVIQQIAGRYADNPNVHIAIIDNTRGKGGAQLADLGFVRGFDYNGAEGKLYEALDQQFQAGRISEAVYRATGERQGLGQASGRADGPGPEQGHGREADNALPDARSVSAAGDELAPRGETLGRTPGDTPTSSDASASQSGTLDQALVQKLAAEQPDLEVILPGTEERISVGEAMKRIADEQKQDRQWADLVRVATECALTAG